MIARFARPGPRWALDLLLKGARSAKERSLRSLRSAIRQQSGATAEDLPTASFAVVLSIGVQKMVRSDRDHLLKAQPA